MLFSFEEFIRADNGSPSIIMGIPQTFLFFGCITATVLGVCGGPLVDTPILLLFTGTALYYYFTMGAPVNPVLPTTVNRFVLPIAK